jgi:hypothetical protein
MENVTTKKGEFAPKLMKRVDSCAHIFMADKPEKISAIMEAREVPALDAGRIYTIGALKAAKRRGVAKNYSEAIEALEAEQAGDRGNPLTRTISADKTAAIVAKYERMNAKTPMLVNNVDVVRMAWARMDKQPLTAYAQPQNWRIAAETQPKAKKRAHTLNVGKVLGALYTEWEAREIEADPANMARHDIIEKNLHVFFKEYKSRQSKTVKTRINELINYVAREGYRNSLKAEQAIRALTSAKGRDSPGISKLAKFASNLHYNFEHKESVTCPEFIGLLCDYGKDD